MQLKRDALAAYRQIHICPSVPLRAVTLSNINYAKHFLGL
jgi:hypothetical protein